MIKTIVFDGGLGNQMFQYAFYLQLRERHPHELYLFDIAKSQDCHNGFELDEVFDIDSRKKIDGFRRLKRCFPRFLKMFHVVKQPNSLEYDPSLIKSSYAFSAYEGFWQSEKYFLSIKEEIRESFAFKTRLLNESTRKLAQKLDKSNFVSVHVRRGDYLLLPDYLGVCAIDYYHHALDVIKDKVDHPMCIFFSDDIPWVRQNLPVEDAVYVDWNKGRESWQDMYLMSQCQHNILANSSFSWWGAWLNTNDDKIVIAPKKWFEFSPNYDILPDQWLAI